MKHAIKIEDLDLSQNEADKLEIVCHNFLSDLGYSNDRIEAIECRRYDGFIPYSHNKGGLVARSYMLQNCLPNGSTGFDNTDKVLERYEEQDLKDFLSDHNLTELDYDNEALLAQWYDYRQNSDDTIEIMARIMFNSETECTLYISVSASDTPYHRSSDDYMEESIEFKNASDLKNKLNEYLKESFIECFKDNLTEAF